MFQVEDGTGLEDSNSYASVEALDAYASLRGEDLSAFSTEQKEQALVIACVDFIDLNYTFRGDPLNEDQAMALPTDKVEVNAKVVQAACAAAVLQLKGRLIVDPEDIEQQIIESESSQVGDLKESLTYKDGQQYVNKYPTPRIDALLKPFTISIGGMGNLLRG